MGAIFAPTSPHSRMLVSLKGELVHVSNALVFTFGTPVFVAATQGMPFDHLTLVARSAFACGTHGTIIERQFWACYHL